VLFRSAYIVRREGHHRTRHRVGAHVILDVFRPPAPFRRCPRPRADFAVGGVLKWLCGGPGVGYLYVRDDLRSRLKPALTGCSPVAGLSPLKPALSIHAKILSGTSTARLTSPRSTLASYRALEILNKAGIAAIRAKSVTMTTRLLESAQSRGWRVNTARKNPADPRRHQFRSTVPTPTKSAANF